MRQRASALLALVLAALSLLPGCGRKTAPETRRFDFTMGSVLDARIFAEEERADPLFDAIRRRVRALNDAISPAVPDSFVSRVNETGEAECPEEIFDLIKACAALCEESGGALDLTLGAATELWGFRTDSPHKPDEKALREALSTANPAGLTFSDPSTVRVRPGQRLDPGAFGKGAGADEAAACLRSAGLSAVVNFGGTVLVFGETRSADGWTVGVRDPFDEDGSWCATVRIPAGADEAAFFSTSGSYEKYFIEDGTVYHHILDPKTGFPAVTDLVSVSVLTKESGLAADALSTALFLLGEGERSDAMLRAHGAEAIFIYKDKTVGVTSGLSGALTLTGDGFRLRNGEES